MFETYQPRGLIFHRVVVYQQSNQVLISAKKNQVLMDLHGYCRSS
jgi:hypothetical protein